MDRVNGRASFVVGASGAFMKLPVKLVRTRSRYRVLYWKKEPEGGLFVCGFSPTLGGPSALARLHLAYYLVSVSQHRNILVISCTLMI